MRVLPASKLESQPEVQPAMLAEPANPSNKTSFRIARQPSQIPSQHKRQPDHAWLPDQPSQSNHKTKGHACQLNHPITHNLSIWVNLVRWPNEPLSLTRTSMHPAHMVDQRKWPYNPWLVKSTYPNIQTSFSVNHAIQCSLAEVKLDCNTNAVSRQPTNQQPSLSSLLQ